MRIIKTLTLNLFAAFTLTLAGCGSDNGVHIDDGGNGGGNEGGGEVVGGDGSFKFTVSEISGASATVQVAPTDKTATYCYDVIEKSVLDGYNDKTSFINEYVAQLKELADMYGAIFGVTLEDLLSKGDESYDYTAYFEPSTDYYVFAAGVSADGAVTTDVSVFPFSTTAPKKSNNTFRVTESNGYVTVTPSDNNDVYIWDILESAEIAGATDSEIIADEIAYLKEEDEISSYAVKGADEYDYSEGLTSGTEYTVIVFGYDGAASTALTKYAFTYNGSGSGGEGGGEIGAGQGVYSETFAGYTGGPQSPYKASDSFTSTATGVTWSIEYGVISQENDNASFAYGNCLTMGGKSGKADDGQSTITSSVLNDGITKLSFAYIANAGKILEVQVLSGGSVVWTSGELELDNNSGATPKTLSFDITGASANAVIKFVNVSSARRISIGNISWTNATGEGGNGSGSGSGSGGGEGGDEGSDFTTLTQDVAYTATKAEAGYYGDYYETGTNNWMLILSNSSDYEIMCEFFTELGNNNPAGRYDIDWEVVTGAAGTGLAGDVDSEGYIYGSWYYNGDVSDYAAAAYGSIAIEQNGSGYNVSVELIDDLGHTVSCNYTGALSIYDGNEETASVSSKSVGNRRGAIKTLHRFSSTHAAANAARRAAVTKTAANTDKGFGICNRIARGGKTVTTKLSAKHFGK